MKHQWPCDRKLEKAPRVYKRWKGHHPCYVAWHYNWPCCPPDPNNWCDHPRSQEIPIPVTEQYGVMFCPLWFHQTIYSNLASVLRQFNRLLRVTLFNCALASSWKRGHSKPLLQTGAFALLLAGFLVSRLRANLHEVYGYLNCRVYTFDLQCSYFSSLSVFSLQRMNCRRVGSRDDGEAWKLLQPVKLRLYLPSPGPSSDLPSVDS